ncbi:hypothetical protein H920_17496 [Fukomys damarensis]|uniref:Uncharacterized protein n=1 Tax=Fukomys damarensis TaxID=885580 RepID=A0A091CT87_FUKDA|nr:hypothetical protein H920_17496 [Fukomys damarensis]
MPDVSITTALDHVSTIPGPEQIYRFSWDKGFLTGFEIKELDDPRKNDPVLPRGSVPIQSGAAASGGIVSIRFSCISFLETA